ncbi:MAG: tetratricopeptide repeat protein, partial [Nitrospiria bacterium]
MRHSGLLCGMVLFVLMSGCALQSSMVEMEDDVETLRKHRWELQGRLERLEKQTRESPAGLVASQKISADLVVRVDDIGTELQVLNGRLSEERHLLTTLSKRMEDQTFRTQDLMNRLDNLEARLFSLEKGNAPQQGETSQEGRTVLPGKTLQTPTAGRVLSPTEAYNLAYNDYLKGNYDLAIITFQNFIQQYPKSALIPQSIYWTGESYYGKKFFSKAIQYFEQLQQDYPRS